MGRSTRSLYPDDEEFLAFGSKLTDAVAQGWNVLHAEQMLRRKSGEVFPAEIATTLFREGGEVVAATSIVRDITERKRAEEKLRESEHNYRALFESKIDGVFVIDVSTDEEWERFCETVGKTALAREPKFATLAERKANEDELDELVGEWTRSLSAIEVTTVLQKARLAAGIVKNTPEVCEDPQLEHRQHFPVVDHREMGQYHLCRFSFNLSETPCEIRMGAPCLGEHNEHVYCELLGMSDEEFVDLLSDGVFE